MKKVLIPLAALALLLVSCGNITPSSSISSETSSTSDSTKDSESVGESTSNSTSNSTSSSENSSENPSEDSSPSNSESPSTSIDSPSESVEPGEVGEWVGIGSASTIVGHYFNPLKGVKLTSTTGIDLTSFVNVSGYVDYGTVGSYNLSYKVNYMGQVETKTRVVNVQNGTFTPIKKTKIEGNDRKIDLGDGSYRTGAASGKDEFIRPIYAPTFIDGELQDKPIPTNGWWTTLISQNYGGGNYNGGNGIYLNPLRSSLCQKGLEITDVGTGWCQYSPTGVGEETAHVFSTFFQDMLVKPTSLNTDYVSSVIDYSDNNCKVALRNSKDGEDEAVVTYTQGSPFVFTEFKNKSTININMCLAGVTGGYRYYNLDGTQLASGITGSGIVVELVSRHIGYGSYPTYNPALGAAIYESSFFLINTPTNSTITPVHDQHSDATMKDRLQITLGNGNYMSICTLNNVSEASFYHQNAYAFMAKSNIDYDVNHSNNKVTTYFRNNVQFMDKDDTKTGVLAIMPHQYRATSLTYSNYTMRTVRGTLKMFLGNAFDTTLSFAGVLPSFTLPSASSFSLDTATSYLQDLDSRTSYDDNDNSEDGLGTDFMDSANPYWNSKAIYPLSQGLIIADQIGSSSYKAAFLSKIEHILVDWYTYSGTDDDRFLFYDETWGSTYYSCNGFGTGSELSDHHFTHGYLIYASAVASMYDQSFYNKYQGMIDFLLKDYMSPIENSVYPTLRSFDYWAGHSWANGFGSFTEGNNQESCGEALNSWTAGYLIGLKEGDETLIDAAIYGFTCELNSIKTYWFDYDNNVFDANYGAYTDVAGIVWGGKYDYATWFGGNPTFIYGIHWLPTGEYCSSYALGSGEKTILSKIYSTYKKAAGGGPNTWYSNMWAIESLVDPTSAKANFNDSKIKGDDYPNELVGSYYMIQAMSGLGNHSASTYMCINKYASGSVYENNGKLVAMVWNASSSNNEVTFKTGETVIKKITINANSFTSIALN